MKHLYLLPIAICFFQISHANPASLDTSFNHNGAATSFVTYTINQAQAVAVQPDGKIVTAGYAGENAIIVKFNNDGTPDITFNSNDLQPGTVVVKNGMQSAAYDVALQPDGKIIIAGFVTNSNNVDNAFIARYNNDGSLDGSFNDSNNNNTGNPIISSFGSLAQLYGIALQPDGKIVVAGWNIVNGQSYALVARYTSKGFLDTTFGSGTGYVTTLIDGVFTKARNVKIQENGNIIVTGQAQINNVQQIVAISYNSSGTTIATFNANSASGYLGSSVSSNAFGLALQPDQKIIIAGSTNPFSLGFDNKYYLIIRLNTDLTLDTTFNAASTTPGYILSSIGLQANDAIVQTDGKIVTCGFNYATNHIAIINRYNNDGSIDPSFQFTVNDTTSNTIANSLALQADGKIVIGGTVGVHISQS